MIMSTHLNLVLLGRSFGSVRPPQEVTRMNTRRRTFLSPFNPPFHPVVLKSNHLFVFCATRHVPLQIPLLGKGPSLGCRDHTPQHGHSQQEGWTCHPRGASWSRGKVARVYSAQGGRQSVLMSCNQRDGQPWCALPTSFLLIRFSQLTRCHPRCLATRWEKYILQRVGREGPHDI